MGIKVRFDGLDTMAMVNHLNHVALGRRVINIYEGDTGDSFLFKLDHNAGAASAVTATATSNNNNDPNHQDDSKDKLLLYMESGIRFHTTTKLSNNSTAGSSKAQLAPFVFALRKHLRGLRLEQVTQLGQGDRVVHFVFGMGDQRRALLLELYAKGNLVLCGGADYTILALLRSHHYDSNSATSASGTAVGGGVQVQVGHVYPVTYAARNVQIDTTSASNNIATPQDDTNNSNSAELSVTPSSSATEWAAWAQTQVRQAAQLATATAQQDAQSTAPQKGTSAKKKSKKDKQAGTITLKTLLLKPSSGMSHFGPNFLEHVILSTPAFATAGLTPHTPLVIDASDNSKNGNVPSVSDWESFLQQFRQEAAKLDIVDPLHSGASDPKTLVKITATPPRGFILYSEKESKDNSSSSNNNNNNNNEHDFSNKVLEEFQPYLLLKQHEGRKVLEFDTFNEAVDTFFGHLEAQKRLLRAEAAEQAAHVKLEKIRHDQQLRLEGLERELTKVQEQAQVVEFNADNVEKALQVINSALDSGMDWEQLEQLVLVEQEENHNPIALLIYQLELEHDAMILELPTAEAILGIDDNDDDNNEEEDQGHNDQEQDDDNNNKKKKKGKNNKNNAKNGNNSAPPQPTKKKKVKKNHVLVTVSLKDTAHGNASQLFAKYRSMKEKSQRTAEASTKALKAAEETAQRQLAEAQQRTQQATNTAVGQIIKPPWFTKFHWFITSDNYLVLGGRDAHQNEVLVKKYLRPGDAYLHADVHGAASCILRAKRIRVPVKNANKGKTASNKKAATTTKTLPLSDQALREAGNFTICRSSAWASKMVTSAWWVESHQVSKTAPTGEYLKVGAFMIRGKKNFLPPTPLEMGLGVMFRLAAPEGVLDPATYARHKNERRDFALMELLQQQEDDDLDSDSDDNDNDKDNPGEQKGRDDGEVEKEAPTAQIENMQPLELEPSEPITESDAGASDQTEVTGEKEQEERDAPSAETSSPTQAESTASPADGPTQSSNKKPSQDKKKKKGLSVKERKLIKKYGSLEEAEKALAEREKEQEQDAPGQDAGDEDGEDQYDADNNAGSVKRGKRGKKKKVMKKYADQDEEDRELAMLALQGGEKIKKSNKDKRTVAPTTEEQKQAAAETAALLVKDASEVAEKLPEDIRAVLAKCVTVQNEGDNDGVVRWEKFDADVLDQLMMFEGPHDAKLAAAKRLLYLKGTTRVDNFSASLAGILRTIRKYGYENLETKVDSKTNGKDADGPKRKTKEEKKAEEAEWKETLAKEGVAGDEIGEDDDGDVDDTAENNKLTGKPHPEDTLLYALPVCAPYQTLSQYTYRIKLTPGNMKRGKAAKQCVEVFLKGDVTGNTVKPKSPATSSSDICKELIKKVSDNDWIQCLCADVKISAAGASKVTKKQKASNKAKAKKK